MILEDSRKFFGEKANALDNWKNLSGCQLVEKYFELEDKNSPLVESCLSAIIYKFWHVLTNRFSRQKKKIAPEEDMLNMYIDSIRYVLEKRVWKNKDSSLYGKSDAANIAINVKLDSLIKNYYIATSRSKRSINYNWFSLDEFMETYNNEDSNPLLIYEEQKDYISEDIKNTVIKYFDKKEYVTAFLIDLICYEDVFDLEESEDGSTYRVYNEAKVRHHMRELDNDYCEYFSKMYNLNYDDVKYSTKYVVDLYYPYLQRKLDYSFQKLKRDKEFISCLKGEIYAN